MLYTFTCHNTDTYIHVTPLEKSVSIIIQILFQHDTVLYVSAIQRQVATFFKKRGFTDVCKNKLCMTFSFSFLLVSYGILNSRIYIKLCSSTEYNMRLQV